MNVEDFKNMEMPETEGVCRLQLIFNKQRELMEKYEEIEASNDLLETPDIPVDLHDRKGQQRLKNFAWRATEEVAEALDALRDYTMGSDEGSVTHIQEEIADALHFLVEMAILAGFKPTDIYEYIPQKWKKHADDIMVDLSPGINRDMLDFLQGMANRFPEHSKSVGNAFTEFMTDLGMTCHKLKNKPWKQSHMLTDIPLFYTSMATTFVTFFNLAAAMGLNHDSLFNLYFRKSEVNKFRQRSNY